MDGGRTGPLVEAQKSSTRAWPALRGLGSDSCRSCTIEWCTAGQRSLRCGGEDLDGGLAGPVSVELEVLSLRRDELIVGALLGDAPVLEHDDPSGLADGGEAVGDHDRGAPREQAAHALLD